MIRKYIHQSWRMIGAEKLYSSLYISGVALSIAAVMVMSMALYANLAPVYPEYNRTQQVYFDRLGTEYGSPGQRRMQQWALSEWTVRNIIDSMKTLECHTAFYRTAFLNRFIYSGENGDNIPLLITPIDANFFKIYDFDFVAGRALTKDEFDGNEKVIILSDRTATELFGNPTDCIGRIIKISFIDYKVIGVVREPSNIMMSYAMGYVPYSAVRDKLMSSNEIVGGYYVVAIPKKGVTHKQISDDFYRCMQPVISANSGIDLEIKTFDRPVSHFTRTFGDALSADATFLWYLAAVTLILLIVPAMNLSGMIVGRMEQRRSEMGIRKSFGATRGVLLGQVLTENLLLTLLGAAAGLILSWVLISSFGRIIFDLLGGADEIPDNTRLTPDMLFSPIIFATVAVMTLILNLLSSYIPVRRALRKPIVESLNNQR